MPTLGCSPSIRSCYGRARSLPNYDRTRTHCTRRSRTHRTWKFQVSWEKYKNFSKISGNTNILNISPPAPNLPIIVIMMLAVFASAFVMFAGCNLVLLDLLLFLRKLSKSGKSSLEFWNKFIFSPKNR